MPIFQDSENLQFIFPDGDYPFTVTEISSKYSHGAKTRGSDVYELSLHVQGPTGPCNVFENLIDHPSCNFKLDLFLKCCGINFPKGQAYDFSEAAAKVKNVPHVNVYGLRGIASFSSEFYTGNDGKKREKMVVRTFYTNKEKLARDASIQPPAAEETKVQDETEVPF